MPTFTFDVTEEAVAHAQDVMDKMPGNEGQASLVANLNIDASAVVTVHIAGPDVDVSSEYDINIGSSHPDAIELIISEGEQAFQEYAERAADIMGLVDEAFKSL